MSRTLAWLRLQLTPGLGRVAQFRLIEHYGDPDAAAQAASGGWPQLPGLRGELARQVPSPDDPAVAQAAGRLARRQAWLLSYWDENYPELLKSIPDPPILLYGCGEWPLGEAMAIVGSRRPTPTGRAMTETFAAGVGGEGFVVVSGLARGIDTAAHRGALQGGGKTLAVLGCGIEQVYPPENRMLFDQIVAQGAVVSEYPPGTPPLPGHFPGRNRLISGLARGVLIVEATADSGSLITADFALEQGREVMAMPGSITQPTSYGPNQLLKQGAHVVTETRDIIELLWRRQGGFTGTSKAVDRAVTDLPATHQRVLTQLDATPRHIDHLAQESGLTPMELSDILLHLELQGYVRQVPGARFILGHLTS